MLIFFYQGISLKKLRFFSFQNLRSLRKTIKTHTYTAVQEVITLIRMAEDYYKCKKDTGEEGKKPSLLFLFDTGYGTCVSGWGPVYDNYCSVKQLGPYTGEMFDQGPQRRRIMPSLNLE